MKLMIVVMGVGFLAVLGVLAYGQLDANQECEEAALAFAKGNTKEAEQRMVAACGAAGGNGKVLERVLK